MWSVGVVCGNVPFKINPVFIVNETLNETRRNTQKLFSHHERNCSAKLFYKRQKTVRPSGEEGLVRGRAT